MDQYTAVTTEVALAAATAKTVLLITAASTKRLQVAEFWVEGDGISGSAEPMVVEVLRKSGTLTGYGSITPNPLDPAAPAALFTAGQGDGDSTEGTDGAVLYRHEVHPQGGKHYVFPLGRYIHLAVNGVLGIRVTSPATGNVVAGFGVDE